MNEIVRARRYGTRIEWVITDLLVASSRLAIYGVESLGIPLMYPAKMFTFVGNKYIS